MLKGKKWLIAVAVLVVTVAVVLSALLPGAETKEGMTFTAGDSNRISKLMEQAPNTVEAWIKFSEDYDPSAPGGVILAISATQTSPTASPWRLLKTVR